MDQLQKTEEALEEEKEMVANLQRKIAKMEMDSKEREEVHKRNYFKMYQKVSVSGLGKLYLEQMVWVCPAVKTPIFKPILPFCMFCRSSNCSMSKHKNDKFWSKQEKFVKNFKKVHKPKIMLNNVSSLDHSFAKHNKRKSSSFK